MHTSAHLGTRRPLVIAVVGMLVLVLAGCTGRGGGQLAPDGVLHNGAASFGFSFACEDKGGLNPPTGQLRIQLSYTERSTQPLLSLLPTAPTLLSPFTIHGVVDRLDPVVESALCIGQNPPPGGHELIFLGRYRLTSTSGGFPSACSGSSITTSSCRFEVVVRDHDRNLAPSARDSFAIQLSRATEATSTLDRASIFYARAGVLSSGNLTVD